MTKITAKVEGMMCGMCEAHVCDAIRKAFNVKKVTASHSKNEVIVLTEGDVDEAALVKVITDAGYTASDVEKEPYESKGIFSAFRK